MRADSAWPALTLLTVASIVAVAAMIHGAGTFAWNWFYPWVVAPYVLLALMLRLPARQSTARVMAGRAAAGLVLVLTLVLYVDAMWLSVSSTSALVFVVAPVYLLTGGLVTWLLVWVAFVYRAAKLKDRGRRT